MHTHTKRSHSCNQNKEIIIRLTIYYLCGSNIHHEALQHIPQIQRRILIQNVERSLFF